MTHVSNDYSRIERPNHDLLALPLVAKPTAVHHPVEIMAAAAVMADLQPTVGPARCLSTTCVNLELFVASSHPMLIQSHLVTLRHRLARSEGPISWRR